MVVDFESQHACHQGYLVFGSAHPAAVDCKQVFFRAYILALDREEFVGLTNWLSFFFPSAQEVDLANVIT
jgi:hypothetical protein